MRLLLLLAIVLPMNLLDNSFQKAEGETLKQCMERCVSYEGGNSQANKGTCKSRCGSVMLKQSTVKRRDCMGVFKSCMKSCGKEKIGQPSSCHKQCKAVLKTCS